MTDKNLAPDEFESGFEAKIHRFFESFQDEFWPQNKTKILAIVVIAIVAIGIAIQRGQASKSVSSENAEALGLGLVALQAQDLTKAESEFTKALEQGSLSGIAKAKAALLLGNIQFEKGELDKASSSYQMVLATASSAMILNAAAEHGLAAVKMDQKDYMAGAALLEAYISKYSRRNAAKSSDDFVEDLTPNVADALYKLALCQAELKQMDEAKVTLQKVISVYDSSRSAASAKKLLSTLG